MTSKMSIGEKYITVDSLTADSSLFPPNRVLFCHGGENWPLRRRSSSARLNEPIEHDLVVQPLGQALSQPSPAFITQTETDNVLFAERLTENVQSFSTSLKGMDTMWSEY